MTDKPSERSVDKRVIKEYACGCCIKSRSIIVCARHRKFFKSAMQESRSVQKRKAIQRGESMPSTEAICRDFPWTPTVENIRTEMMRRFSDKLSMEEIASFAYEFAPVIESALVGMQEECAKVCDNYEEVKRMKGQRDREGAAHNLAIAIRSLPLSVPSLDALRDELIEECCKADCYLCRDGDRPVSTDVSGNGGFIWLHKNNAKCRASNLRALKGAKR